MKVKEESEKVGLKLNIQKTKIMACVPITSWWIDGETVETVADFIFGGSKITADGDCSHEIKTHLLLGRKAMTKLDSILKNRDITLPTKVRLVKAMVFPVVMYGCKNWTVKKAEHWRTDVFELWCWRRLFFFFGEDFFFQLELIPLLNKLHLGADCHRPQEKMHLAFAEINIVQQCPISSSREVNLSLEEGLRRLPHWRWHLLE